MIIKQLKINNIRNIKSAELEPHARFNILHGANGAGKTSVLEAMVVLAKGRSFRSGNIRALIGPDYDSFRVYADTRDDQGRRCRVGIERSADQWQAKIDGVEAHQISDLAPRLPLVLLEPNSHQLISGAPDYRRRFIDWGVFHVKHDFLGAWRRYTRVIRQRNAALRSGDRRMTVSLDPQLVKLGVWLENERRRHVAQMAEKAGQLLEVLSPGMQAVTLGYEPGWRGEDLADALSRNLQRDMERGFTGSGPHRADLTIRLDGSVARERLSRGEQKILAAALLLTQATVMNSGGGAPMLLLDDLSSEFDRIHLSNVVSAAKELGAQLWVTGTTPEPYLEAGVAGGVMFHVKQGEIRAS